ncbi:MAG: helix-turn-helix domain-containing protein [Thermomicrobiales bacterium]
MGTLMAIERLLDEIGRLADEDRTKEIKVVVARAREEIVDDDTLVTTTQAAKLLGINSINTVKSMVKRGDITGIRKVGNRTMIPLGEIKRLQDTSVVRDLRAIADAMTLGALPDEDDGTRMSQEQMDILEAGRPGTLPWKK